MVKLLATKVEVNNESDMKRIYFILIPLVLLINQESMAQKKFTVSGYVKYMEMVSFQNLDSLWTTNSIIHNRLDFEYFPKNWLNVNVSVRNRLIYGEMVTFSQPPFSTLLGNTGWNYIDETDKDVGFVDLSWNLIESDSYFFNTSIDRAFVNIQKGKWDFTAGRQRINWGQTFVWNPNDLFNAYSYFDFDYEEKPGSDGIRAQYFIDYASRIEVAAAVNNDTNLTAAALYQFNKFNYDIQLIAGIFNSEDAVAGFGWSGNFWNAALRGELSYFYPLEQNDDDNGTLAASVGMDYSFKNGSMIQYETLFNSSADKDWDFNLSEFYNQPISAKNLSMTRWSFFASYIWPVTPLININLSGMYSPQNNFSYIGPSASFSLSNNFMVDITIQSFFSDISKEDGGTGTYAFLRGKWSF